MASVISEVKPILADFERTIARARRAIQRPARLSDPKDGVYSDPVTVRKILRVLVVGFSAVIVLLIAAGFIGLKSAQLIQENSAEIVHNALVLQR